MYEMDLAGNTAESMYDKRCVVYIELVEFVGGPCPLQICCCIHCRRVVASGVNAVDGRHN